LTLPKLPAPVSSFISYINDKTDIVEALKPFKLFESKLREIYAQDPSSVLAADPHANVLPLFAGHEQSVKIRARNLQKESDNDKEKYLLGLPEEERRQNGSLAIVPSMKDFKSNFSLFTELSLADLDWSNVIAAGSSVVVSLLPVPAPHSASKRALRAYYHENWHLHQMWISSSMV
jgi:hypothetical protein